MPKIVTYKCPDCEGEFDFMHHPSDDPPPERCELCGSFMGEDIEPEPVLKISIGTAKGKVGDKLYRQLESSSDARAEIAAEMTGADKSEMSAMRITNLGDNSRPGDRASVANVTQATSRLSTQMARPEMQNPQAAAWAGETTSGPAALSTRRLMDQMPHRQIAAQATAASRLNKV